MNKLQPESALADLNRVSGYDRSFLRRVNDVFRSDGLFSVDAATSMVAISGLGRSLSGRSQGSEFSLRRAFSRAGLCTADVPGELAGYRSLFEGDGSEALSYGDSQYCFTEQPLQRKREPRLAHLCRVRTNSDSTSQRTLRWRFGISRSRCNGLCARLDDDRSVHDALSMGAFSQGEKRGENAHPVEPVRQYSRVYPDNRGQRARCECARPFDSDPRSVLRDGSGISRFRKTLHATHTQGLLRNPRKKELSVSASILPTSGSKHRFDLRPNNCAHGVLCEATLSRSAQTNQIPRSRWTHSDLSDQRFFTTGSDGGRFIPKT